MEQQHTLVFSRPEDWMSFAQAHFYALQLKRQYTFSNCVHFANYAIVYASLTVSTLRMLVDLTTLVVTQQWLHKTSIYLRPQYGLWEL